MGGEWEGVWVWLYIFIRFLKKVIEFYLWVGVWVVGGG